MTNTSENRMAAPCGTWCQICVCVQAKDSPELMESLVARGIPREKLPCPGCREVEGLCPVLPEPCATYRCAVDHGVNFCHECDEFPCEKLNPAAHRAEVLPHNIKIYHLCYQKQHGLTAWKEAAPEIQKRYFQGVMKVGRGPVLE